MNEIDTTIKRALLEGRLILFLGAGASKTSRNSAGTELLDSRALAQALAEKAGWSYQGEPLATVYMAAKAQLGAEVDRFLTELYRDCRPSQEFLQLAEYAWARIYTTNIDDALENALRLRSQQQVVIRDRNDRVEDRDQLFRRLDLVYLNGRIGDIDKGLIFSPEEYGKAAAGTPLWYRELASDFFACTFLFIGTKLDEPLFYQQVEYYKSVVSFEAPRSFVLTPEVTEIERRSLSAAGLTHIRSTLDKFLACLRREVPTPIRPLDLACARIPTLRAFVNEKDNSAAERKAKLFQDVIVVSPSLAKEDERMPGAIRDFYRGFKPTWTDIVDNVPARLKQYDEYLKGIRRVSKGERKSFVLIGPAGSGKTTLLMMAAMELAIDGEIVYFVHHNCKQPAAVLAELDQSATKPYFVFFDRLDPVRDDLLKAWEEKNIRYAVICSAEGQNVWVNRVQPNIGGYIGGVLPLHVIDAEDTQEILNRLRDYGPWTRLSQMSEAQRRQQIFEKSKRQLLIGLLEATTGLGFEKIIQNDYERLTEPADRLFVVLVCLCTMQKAHASPSLTARALLNLGIKDPPEAIASRLPGVLVALRSGGWVARHPVYARRVIEGIVSTEFLLKAIYALLDSFAQYSHPVVLSLNKNDAIVFKALFNHGFLRRVLRDHWTSIMGLYSAYEKVFEKDGLFWLQYGLATRDMNDQWRAYERLMTAYHAYPMDHTIHALAQQELILATIDTTPPERARTYLHDAIKRLKELDDTLKSDDTYPLVTLTEGHVKALRRLDGEAAARVQAKTYVTTLERRIRQSSDDRVRQARETLLRYATTGTWSEEPGDETDGDWD